MAIEQPDFGSIGFEHAAELPGVRRKLRYLAQRTAANGTTVRQQVEQTLARVVDAK